VELEQRTTAPAHATGVVAFVPLAALAADVTFRLREEGDVAALAASIGRLGQLVPVELRPLPEAVEGGPRYQVVAGFRRLAALRLLFRDRVLARVHPALEDEDAWAVALGQALLTEPLDREGLELLRERLAANGVAPWADELVDEALVRAPVEPELREQFYEFLGFVPLPDESGGDAPPGDEPAAEAPGAEILGDIDASVADIPPDEMAAMAALTPPVELEPADLEVTPEELAEDVAARLYQVNADLAVAFEVWADLPPEGRRQIVEQARWIAELLPLIDRDLEGEVR
jgi:ParB-like nuclease family protein